MERVRKNCFVVLSLILLLGQAPSVFAQRPSGSRRVLVGFRRATGPQTPQARAEAVRSRGGTVHKSLRSVPVVSATLSDQAIARLGTRADVEYIEEDVILYAIAQTKPWGVDRIDADLAWPGGNTGRGVKVAILDTGIDYDHSDLAAAGGVNYAGAANDGSTNPSHWNDIHGHGTHCAGIVAARNNTIGGVGVAPDASLWAVKVLSDTGSGYTSDIIQGLDWCVANGIKVASMSLGGGSTTSLRLACDRVFAQGVVLVAAAGNTGGPVMYPAAYPSVIAVSAVDSRDSRASFSGYGPQIALGAPGVSIYSTYKNGGYAYMSGTSMACPHVAGAAALAWASGLGSATAVRDRLTTTAEDLGTQGFDTSFGYGLVDAEKAAGTATPPSVDNPPTVDITSPAQGTAVSGVVVVRATAEDDKGVTRVEFLLDGARIGLDTQGADGWSASWNSAASADGQHSLTARATDTAGQTADDTITLNVNNVDGPPSVQITSPQNGTTVSETVSIRADAGDDEGVASVRFAVDGATVAVDSDGRDGWSVEWNTTTSRDGTHTVTAVATDTRGQTASHSVSVTVSNAAAPTPPEGTKASVSSITYSTAGGADNNLDLYVTLHVEDNLGNSVAGAFVLGRLSRNGWVYTFLMGTTDASGSATLKVARAPSGVYETTILSLNARGLTWDGGTPPNGFTK